MAVLHIRRPDEVPAPSKSSRAVREQQRRYEEYIRNVAPDRIGELQLEPGESLRGVKVRLRRASSRLGIDLEVWDQGESIYFRRLLRRGRPRKST